MMQLKVLMRSRSPAPPHPLAETLTAAATLIQRHARGLLARRHFAAAREAVLVLQAAARGMLARKRAREAREQKAALAIQTAFRRHRLREQYKHAVARIVSVQALWRGRQVGRALRVWLGRRCGAACLG